MSNVIDTTRLHWSSSTKTFTGDASEIGVSIQEFLSVRSHRTGEMRDFLNESIDRDDEGDILCWVYKCDDMNLVIFND